MTPKLKTFKASHLADLKLANFQLETLGALEPRYGRLLEENSWVAQSLYYGPKVVACWGLLPLWSGVSEAWMLVSDSLRQTQLLMIHAIRQILDVADEHRIQTSVLSDFKKGQDFVEFLGFKREGIMRAYDTKQRDHIRYARTRPWPK